MPDSIGGGQARPMAVVGGLAIEVAVGRAVHARGADGFDGFAGGHPIADFIEVEAPDAPDLESWQGAILEQAVDRDAMDVEVVRKFGDGQDPVCHFTAPLARLV